MQQSYGVGEDKLVHYTCHKISSPLTIDGDLTKDVWKAAPQSRRFVDLVNGEPAVLDTRVACLWDEKALYVAFWVDEPKVTATLTERDSYIWFDNDVEVFFAGDDCYYEFELNAFNTVYEVFFIYQDALKKGSRFDRPEFDLYTRDIDVLSGFQDPTRNGKHPRGKRWAFMDWDFPGMRSAVKVDGRINDPHSIDRGWTVEIAFPWEGMAPLFANRTLPPREGDQIRAQFFRFENFPHNGKKGAEGVGWSLNEHGAYDSHIPEAFPYLHFTETPPQN